MKEFLKNPRPLKKLTKLRKSFQINRKFVKKRLIFFKTYKNVCKKITQLQRSFIKMRTSTTSEKTSDLKKSFGKKY